MNYFKKSLPYFAAPILALAVFFLYFNLWNVDLAKPIFNNYEWDTLLNTFFVKSIVDNGWVFVNKFVGLPNLEGGFYLYDFPLEGHFFNFLIFKLFAFFTSNPFLILNLYFFTTIALVALTSFVALRNFGISIFSALLISVLYDFIFYHIQRSIVHCFLANYATIPLVIMVGYWIISNKIQLIIINQKNQYSFKPNRFFFIAILIAVFVATNDVYYAVYAVMFFIMAWIIQALQSGKFLDLNFVNLITISGAILFVLLCLYIPSFEYWIANGPNRQVAIRAYSDSETYGLRIVDLLLPVSTHFIDYLANIRNFFNDNIIVAESAKIERESEALGILGSFGFIFLLFWFFASSFVKSKILQKTIHKLSLKTSEIIMISNLAALNLLVVLFSTVGGLIMVIVPFFSMLRAHARFSVIIAFISLLMVAIIFDKFLDKNIFKRKIYSQIIIVIIAVLALFDQLGSPKAEQYNNRDIAAKFISDKNFIAEIESKIPSHSHIFILPFSKFPEGSRYTSLIAYLHSKNTLWSYPSMRGRPSAIWQNEVGRLEFKELITAIKEKGFNGVFIDRKALAINFAETLTRNPEIKTRYINRCNREEDLRGLRAFELKLEKITKLKLVSQNSEFSFYEL